MISDTWSQSAEPQAHVSNTVLAIVPTSASLSSPSLMEMLNPPFKAF